MRHIHPATVMAFAAAVAAGCGSPGASNPRRPTLTYAPPQQPQPARPPVTTATPKAVTIPPSVAPRTNLPPALPRLVPTAPTLPVVPPPTVTTPPATPARPPVTVQAPATAGAWIALGSWAAANGLSQPQRHGNSTNAFQLRTESGTLVITAGSQVATWGGMKFHLGFAPQLSNRQLQVHSLDAQKNLLPLLSPAPMPPRGNRVVVIDPGHGGDNTGARSIHNNKLEKEYTLDWARRIKPLLEQRGWKVVLTRTADTPLGLQERIALADRHRPDLFLSLHFNAAASSHSGLETYALTPAGMPSNLTRDFKDDPSEVLPGNAWDRANLQFAARIHRALLQGAGLTDRGVRHARFMTVLRGQNRPAVLIEAGYLSNPTEARLIADPAHRQKLALAVAKALE